MIYEAANTVALNLFGYEHEISSGSTLDVKFTPQEVEEMHTARFVYLLLGYDSEIEHIIEVFDLNAFWTDVEECLVFSDVEFNAEIIHEMDAVQVGYELAQRGR